MKKIEKKVERLTEPLLLYKQQRWVFTCGLLLFLLARVIYFEGYVAITYLLGFHIMKKSIGFLTPLGIPSIIEEDLEEDQGLYDVETV